VNANSGKPASRLNGAAPWVAIGLTLFLNAAIGFWVVSDISTRIGMAERILQSRENHAIRLGVLEDRWRTITATLDDIRRDLKSMIQRRTER